LWKWQIGFGPLFEIAGGTRTKNALSVALDSEVWLLVEPLVYSEVARFVGKLNYKNKNYRVRSPKRMLLRSHAPT
jgi:hypothetical protein